VAAPAARESAEILLVANCRNILDVINLVHAGFDTLDCIHAIRM